jgi:DNA invertase Pin-like site-specific DNA recombinase
MPPDPRMSEPEQRPPSCFAYLRVSHRNSAESGLSAGSQLDMCYRYYQSNIQRQKVAWWGLKEIPKGLTITHYRKDIPLLYDVAVSARHIPLLNRPGGARLGTMAKKGDHVIFAHLDRAIRAIRDHCALLDLWQHMGIHIHYADMNVDLNTPEGMLVANMMAVVAQAQSDFISRRCKETHQRLGKLGRPANGHPPLGKKLVGRRRKKFVPDWEKRAYMAELVRLHDEEGLSFTRVCRSLNMHLCKIAGIPYHKSSWVENYVWKPATCSNAYHAWLKMVKDDPSVAEHPEVLAMKGAVTVDW